MTKILSCDLHDYLEIACMFNYTVEFVLKDGQKHQGRPETIIISDHKELIVFHPDIAPGEVLHLSVLALKSMRVLSKNARFEFIEFS